MSGAWYTLGRVRSVNARAREVRVVVRSGDAPSIEALAWVRFRHGAERPLRCKVVAARRDGEVAILTLGPGVSRDVVGRLRGTQAVLAPEEVPARPEREPALEDLIDLTVCEPAGTVLGKVTEVYEGPANHAFAVQRPDGRTCVLPLIEAVVQRVDLEAGVIHVGDITAFVVEE
jgi:ribosomal 30S subunit maturation factor RimM